MTPNTSCLVQLAFFVVGGVCFGLLVVVLP